VRITYRKWLSRAVLSSSLFGLGLACSPAIASESLGLVSEPLVLSTGFVLFGVTPDGVLAGTKPACSSLSQNSQWAFDVKTPAGRAMYATILTAFTTGKKLKVIGNNSCDTWYDRETVYYLFIPQ
jgi:hypothetical protein